MAVRRFKMLPAVSMNPHRCVFLFSSGEPRGPDFASGARPAISVMKALNRRHGREFDLDRTGNGDGPMKTVLI